MTRLQLITRFCKVLSTSVVAYEVTYFPESVSLNDSVPLDIQCTCLKIYIVGLGLGSCFAAYPRELENDETFEGI